MNVDTDDETTHIQDDVPVYDPLYPEYEYECSHPSCEQKAEPSFRVCKDCVPIMLADAPDTCDFCDTSLDHRKI